MVGNPKRNSASVSAGLERSGLERLLKASSRLRKIMRKKIALIQPEVNSSTLLILDELGVPAIFQTALSAEVEIAMANVDSTNALKISMDDPTSILEVALPYFRNNKKLVEAMFGYCIDSKRYKPKERKRIDVMLNGGSYAGINEEDSGYADMRFEASIDADKRKDLNDDGELLFEMFMDFSDEVMSNKEAKWEEIRQSLEKFFDDGFENLGKARMDYLITSYQLEVANLLYIMKMDMDLEGEYLDIREEIAIASEVRQKAKNNLDRLVKERII